MKQNGVSKLDLKRINRCEILRIVCCGGPISRIDLAKQLHLTRAAVTIITAEMMEQGILYEKGEYLSEGERATRGRKKVLLDICENYRFSFGVVLDHKSLHIGLATMKGQTLDHRTLPIVGMTVEEIVELTYEQVQEIMQLNCLTNHAILGIGACLSGTGTRLFQKQSEQECVAILRRMMEIRFSIPVTVGTTTPSLALAERYFFSQKEQHDNILFVRYDYDLDAAILLGGDLYQANRPSNWFGHVVVDTHGDYCTCGKIGCCCTRMSIDGIIQKIKERFGEGRTPGLYHQTGGDVHKVDFSLENVDTILGEESVKELYYEAFRYLTTALDNVLTVLNPTRIVLFGFVFERMVQLNQLVQIMEKEHKHSLKDRIVPSQITESHIFLAGSGQCVKQFFIDRGAL